MITVINSFSTRELFTTLDHFDFDLKLILVVIQHYPGSLVLILVAEILDDYWFSY